LSHGHDHDHDHPHDHDPGPRGLDEAARSIAPDHDHAAHHDHPPAARGGASQAKHEHEHEHEHDLRSTPLRRLIAAFVVTALFMFVEAGVGFWSKSLALVADAGHMLADAAALGLAIIAQRIASQQRTRAQTYGFRRAEVLAAFANGIALGITAIWIFIEAAARWRDPPAIQAMAMTLTAVVGLLVNLGSAAMLGAGAHGHNVNTRGALAHVLTDALGSVGAIAAGALVLAFGWNRADPAISAAIGVLVLWGGYRLVRETTRVLMEGSPAQIDLDQVQKTLRDVPGVADFHDLHLWSISDGFDVLTVHVVLARGFHGTDVVAAVSRRLSEVHKLTHCTIQPEAPNEAQLVTLGRRRHEG
jgi:cobalt-zinc-cadmium efflux system protein